MDNCSYGELIGMVLADIREHILSKPDDVEDIEVPCDDDVRSSMDRATAEAYIVNY